MKKAVIPILLSCLIIAVGLWFRLYHINFGLPHSFHADEPEIAELTIKYTYEIRNIISERNYYKLIPVSYVYGTFPAYFYTGTLMFFSKISNTLNFDLSKESIYVFLRVINALLSVGICAFTGLLIYKVTKNITATLTGVFLASFNWLYIVNAHYVNQDTILSILILLSYLICYSYLTKSSNKFHTILLGLVLGLSAGTKVTALITLPAYIYLFLYKKDYRGLVAMLFVLFGTFVLTNPFSIIFANDFVFRIYEMLFKEAGVVLDSIDTNHLKYISSLMYSLNPFVLVLSLVGVFTVIKNKNSEFLQIHKFFIINIFIYLIFYSLNLRKVDRWMLPIFPLLLLYASTAFQQVLAKSSTVQKGFLYLVLVVTTLYYPAILLSQYARNTPKSEAYLWMQKNTEELSNKLVITEEGLDPMNKLPNASVVTFNVYESEGAFLAFPPDPLLYDYVVLSSKPMSNFKKDVAKEKAPYYVQKWTDFEQTVLDEKQFILVKDFELPKPNLANLSDVYIYKKL